MKGKLLISIFIISILVISIAILYNVFHQYTSSPGNIKNNTISPTADGHQITLPSKGNKYLTIKGEDNTTKVYLINSSIKYGTYEEEINGGPMGYVAKIGDPCVIINGTIRNDYDTDYYIYLTCELYNKSGVKVGEIITNPSHPWHPYTYEHVKSKETGTFEIYVKYDKRDISDYEVFLSVRPDPSLVP